MNKVIVTGIGGNVGQGVLMNLRRIDPDIYILGTNVVSVSAGNHLCDEIVKMPYAYEEGYAEKMDQLIKNNDIDLVIPTTDYECFYLSKHKVEKVITSPFETNKNFVNKYNTYLSFKANDIPFATSYLPSEFDSLPKKDYIFKPKEGRGSRGIEINPPDASKFNDEDYMIQDYIEGREITSAFYVTKTGDLFGILSMWRELANGTTVSCVVTHEYEEELRAIILKIVQNYKIVGACNMQSRITSEGRIVPFEINGRISGTNSIRPSFGFDDLRYILNEYLYDKPLPKFEIKQGAALRILKDIIYEDLESLDDIKGISTKHFLP